MRPPLRLIALVAVLAWSAVVPFVTVHALLLHFTDMGHNRVGAWVGDPGLLGVVALTALSTVSTVAVVLALVHWGSDAARLGRLHRYAIRAELFGHEVFAIPGDEILLFAAGAFHGRVFVSEGAVRALPESSLRAALLHERAHIERRDVAWRSSLAVVDRAFGRLPGVRSSVHALALRAECDADRRAIAMGADRQALFDAIVMAAAAPRASAALSGVAVLPRLELIANPGARQPRIPIAGPAVIAAWLLAPPLLAHAAIVVGAVCVSRL